MRPYISAIKLTGEIGNGSYLAEIPAIRFLMEAEQLELESPVTFFVGENGTGKSTLLEAVAVAYGFNPEGGTKNFRFSTEDSHSELWQGLTLVKRGYAKDGFFLRAESFYNVASNIDQMDREPSLGGRVIDSYGGVSLHHRSHGESFLALVQNRFGGHGVYLLDEPEAALSPTRQLTLLGQIDELVKRESQLIIATHAPILMAYPGAQIFLFSEDGIQPVDYRETEHYQVTRRFLEDPERMLRYLLEE
ncbi:MAG: AAA family ATPase [Oscillospiraceae bacterium]|nr:AAA family ATPase [Oscillospiraceae bacterium]